MPIPMTATPQPTAMPPTPMGAAGAPPATNPKLKEIVIKIVDTAEKVTSVSEFEQLSQALIKSTDPQIAKIGQAFLQRLSEQKVAGVDEKTMLANLKTKVEEWRGLLGGEKPVTGTPPV